MASGLVKSLTVGIASVVAVVAVGFAVASPPALGEQADAAADIDHAEAAGGVVPPADAPIDGTTPPADGTPPPADGTPPPAPGAEAATTPPTGGSEGAGNDPANAAVAEAAADPFAAPGPESDAPADEVAFDAETVRTDYQCAPPALSPAALLVELQRSRRKQVKERENLERVRDEILALRVELAEQAEEVEKKIATLVAEKQAAIDRAEATAAAVAAEEALAKAPAKEKPPTPEEIAKQRAMRRIEVQRLAATTKGMGAGEAALFLGALDVGLAAEVVAQMKPKLAGAALAQMRPKSAAKIASRVVEGAK